MQAKRFALFFLRNFPKDFDIVEGLLNHMASQLPELMKEWRHVKNSPEGADVKNWYKDEPTTTEGYKHKYPDVAVPSKYVMFD